MLILNRFIAKLKFYVYFFIETHKNITDTITDRHAVFSSNIDFV